MEVKKYDLEERSFGFARDVRRFVKKLPRTISNLEDSPQLVRSSGSVGANYIEANEALGKKDFLLRVKISRKEAKESVFWLKLVDTTDGSGLEEERIRLIQEANELKLILSKILNNAH